MERKTQNKKRCELCKIPKYFKDVWGHPNPDYWNPEDDLTIYQLCGHCKIMIKGDKDLEHHIQNVHLDGGTYRCRQCLSPRRSSKVSSSYNRLCEMMNMCDEGFNELTDIAIIAGDAIAYVLNESISDVGNKMINQLDSEYCTSISGRSCWSTIYYWKSVVGESSWTHISDQSPKKWTINLMKHRKEVNLYVITSKSKISEREKIKEKILNILRREMRYVKEIDCASHSLDFGPFFEGISIDSYRIDGYPDLPWIKINIINSTYTPKELVGKFYLDHQECYYHKGNFWISDKAQKAFDTKLTELRGGILKGYWMGKCEESAKRMGYELVRRELN